MLIRGLIKWKTTGTILLFRERSYRDVCPIRRVKVSPISLNFHEISISDRLCRGKHSVIGSVKIPQSKVAWLQRGCIDIGHRTEIGFPRQDQRDVDGHLLVTAQRSGNARSEIIVVDPGGTLSLIDYRISPLPAR